MDKNYRERSTYPFLKGADILPEVIYLVYRRRKNLVADIVFVDSDCRSWALIIVPLTARS